MSSHADLNDVKADARALFTVVERHSSATVRVMPTDYSRGPWDHGLLHAGPLAGLAAWAAEHCVVEQLVEASPGMVCSRLTVELLSAVPQATLEVTAVVAKPGNRSRVVDVTMTQEGVTMVRATTQWLRPTIGWEANDGGPPSRPDEVAEGEFAATVQPILEQNCVSCHTEGGPGWTTVAFDTAHEVAEVAPDIALVDARALVNLPFAQRAVRGGDARVGSIAAASIVAKVHRDGLMRELAGRYPGYGFARNKGYGTAEHLRALARNGPTPEHRYSFAPVRDAATADEDLSALLTAAKRDAAADCGGALLFTCNGRGTRLFDAPHHDAGALASCWHGLPVAGFFAQGEIGPIGGKNFLHGFTASIALFHVPQ